MSGDIIDDQTTDSHVMAADGDAPENTKGVFVRTYGCQMNVYDSERMVDLLKPIGFRPVDRAEDAELVILNTCHIREKAAEKVYSELGRLKKIKTKRKDARAMIIPSRWRAVWPRPRAAKSRSAPHRSTWW